MNGAPADFAVVDPPYNWKVEPAHLRSRSKNTPFEHRTLEGRAIETWIAGRKIYSYADEMSDNSEAIVMGYFAGSIPFGLLLAHFADGAINRRRIKVKVKDKQEKRRNARRHA